MPKTIPVLKVDAGTLPEGWERSVIACWNEGAAIRTEYDKEGDPPSRDCTMIVSVAEPFAEPRIHRCFPGGLDDLEVYRQEVIHGVHDHWIDPAAGKWEYTYSERLFKYSAEGKVVDQIDYVVKKLSEAPHTRRAQAVTWKAWVDPQAYDPPCLQRLWFRIHEDALTLNVHLRSNDAYKAAFMNMFVFTDLQRTVAERVSERMGKAISVGGYVHMADSYHIYGSYFDEFKGFLDTVAQRTFEERVWATAIAEPFFEDGRKRVEGERAGDNS